MSFINKTKLNNKGFSHFEIGISIVVIAIIAVVGVVVYNGNNNKSNAGSGGNRTNPSIGIYTCRRDGNVEHNVYLDSGRGGQWRSNTPFYAKWYDGYEWQRWVGFTVPDNRAPYSKTWTKRQATDEDQNRQVIYRVYRAGSDKQYGPELRFTPTRINERCR